MVVEREQEAAARGEWKRFADQLERSRGIWREDENVVVRAGMEIAQHGSAGAFDVLGHRRGSGVGGVWIAENAGAQQGEVLLELRFRMERTTGVIEVDLALRIQAPILGRAQLVQSRGLRIAGIAREEIRVRGLPRRLRVFGGRSHLCYLISARAASTARTRAPILIFTKDYRDGFAVPDDCISNRGANHVATNQ